MNYHFKNQPQNSQLNSPFTFSCLLTQQVWLTWMKSFQSSQPGRASACCMTQGFPDPDLAGVSVVNNWLVIFPVWASTSVDEVFSAFCSFA